MRVAARTRRAIGAFAGLALLAPTAASEPALPELALVGDSITAGNVAPSGHGGTPYAEILRKELAGTYRVTNHAVGGTTTTDWLPQGALFGSLPAADVVVILLGSADAFFLATAAPVYQAHMQSIVDALLERGVGAVIVVAPPPHPGSPRPTDLLHRRLERYGELLSKLCRAPHVACGPNLFVGLTPLRSYFVNPGEGLDSDPHPNADGHRRIAELLIPAIRAVASSP